MKLTKRKGFNFFRSYFDVYNELEKDSDKVAFIDALFNRQFLGIKPTELKGMAKFAYISQTNSIDSQVKGYEDKMKVKLNPLEVVKTHPTVGVDKKEITPPPQLQVKEEVKEKIIYTETITEEVFLKRWKDARLYYDKKPTNIAKLTTYEKLDFSELKKDYILADFEKAMQGLFQQSTFPSTRLRPSHFLKREYFETYLTCFQTKEKLFDNSKNKKIERI